MMKQKESLPIYALPVRKRSVIVHGHKTSVSLEDLSGRLSTRLRGRAGMSRAMLIELIAQERKVGNLSSAVRLFVLEHFRGASRRGGEAVMRSENGRS